MLCAASHVSGWDESFSWAWEDASEVSRSVLAQADPPDSSPLSEVSDVLPAVEPNGEQNTFEWTWEEPDDILADVDEPEPAADAGFIADETSVASEDGEAERGGIDADAYDALLKENLRLRREVADVAHGEEAVRQENERLTSTIRDLEKRMADLALVVRELQGGAAEGDPAETVDGDVEPPASDPEGIRQDNARLRQEIGELRQQLALDEPDSGEARPVPKQGSAIYRQIERENALLKEKLIEIETARRKAEQAREKMVVKVNRHDDDIRQERAEQKKLQRKLAEAKTQQKDYRATLETLLRTIPDLEKELAGLREQAQTRNAALAQNQSDLATVQLELEKREHRVKKAEMMAELMEKTREEVKKTSDREKRDMHFNMAAVYYRDGKYRAAEQEYLRALRVDSTDAGSHYNIGILYENEFGDLRKAAMHYRKYLKLAPGADDVDTVKGWLVELEMN